MFKRLSLVHPGSYTHPKTECRALCMLRGSEKIGFLSLIDQLVPASACAKLVSPQRKRLRCYTIDSGREPGASNQKHACINLRFRCTWSGVGAVRTPEFTILRYGCRCSVRQCNPQSAIMVPPASSTSFISVSGLLVAGMGALH